MRKVSLEGKKGIEEKRERTEMDGGDKKVARLGLSNCLSRRVHTFLVFQLDNHQLFTGPIVSPSEVANRQFALLERSCIPRRVVFNCGKSFI